MQIKTLSFMVFSLSINVFFSSAAHAMPEEKLNTHNSTIIPNLILQKNGKLDEVKAQLSQVGVPELDDLWNTRRDIVDGVCDDKQNNCRAISVFPGKNSDHPVVMLPGFTAYRKLYLEQIYDLIQSGYGPIYISDFTGTGDSYKPELKPGQHLPTINEYMASLKPDMEPELHQKIVSIVGEKDADQMRKAIGELPIGRGYIRKFSDYTNDIDLLMNIAVKENPTNKIMLTSLSMSGLNLALALATQGKHPVWISSVDRIVLESPMIRIRATDKVIPKVGMLSDLVTLVGGDLFGSSTIVVKRGAVLQFVDKALGNFNPDNTVSHSPIRISLTDGVRVWNGHETGGGTFGWAYEELTHQYALDPLDILPLVTISLNQRVPQIAKALKDNNITLITVASEADPLVDTSATKSFVQDLAEAGVTQSSLCLFQTAKHQIDIETDKYREPFMSLLYDQKDHQIKSSYGLAPRNELLECAPVVKKAKPEVKQDDES